MSRCIWLSRGASEVSSSSRFRLEGALGSDVVMSASVEVDGGVTVPLVAGAVVGRGWSADSISVDILMVDVHASRYT